MKRGPEETPVPVSHAPRGVKFQFSVIGVVLITVGDHLQGDLQEPRVCASLSEAGPAQWVVVERRVWGRYMSFKPAVIGRKAAELVWSFKVSWYAKTRLYSSLVCLEAVTEELMTWHLKGISCRTSSVSDGITDHGNPAVRGCYPSAFHSLRSLSLGEEVK